MKEVKTTFLLKEAYRKYARGKLLLRNQSLLLPKFGASQPLGLQFIASDGSAYSTMSKQGKFLIVIGGGMVSKIAKLPESFTDFPTFKPYLNPIVYAIFALNYHEVAHVLFTDMGDRTIIDYPEPKYINFQHDLFNILEDCVVEYNIDIHFQKDPSLSKLCRPKKLFNFVIKRLFEPKCDEYQDDGTQEGFMNYLLLLVRCGRSKIKGTCAVFDKYRADLIPMIKAVLEEPNATERIHKSVALGEWIIKNITEFNWELPDPPEGPVNPGPVLPGKPQNGYGKGPGIPGGGGAGNNEGENEGEEEEDPNEEGDPNEMEEDFDETIHDGDDHTWVIAKEVFFPRNEDQTRKDIEETISKYLDTVQEVSDFLTLFKEQIAPREHAGFTSGRLNVFSAMQDEMKGGSRIDLFNRDVAGGEDKDLVVSLLVDNSGSMAGQKSHICAQATAVLAQACEWSNIPFECNAFDYGYYQGERGAVTVVEKSFEDTFEEAKPYFAINDSTLIRQLDNSDNIPTFCGNIEETNLFFIWKEFAKVKHKTKLLFVLCDGLTCGSSKDLKNLVGKMEDQDGIIVIGIGICCKAVEDIYRHSKVFSTMEELEQGLAKYLVETISQYAE